MRCAWSAPGSLAGAGARQQQHGDRPAPRLPLDARRPPSSPASARRARQRRVTGHGAAAAKASESSKSPICRQHNLCRPFGESSMFTPCSLHYARSPAKIEGSRLACAKVGPSVSTDTASCECSDPDGWRRRGNRRSASGSATVWRQPAHGVLGTKIGLAAFSSAKARSSLALDHDLCFGGDGAAAKLDRVQNHSVSPCYHGNPRNGPLGVWCRVGRASAGHVPPKPAEKQGQVEL